MEYHKCVKQRVVQFDLGSYSNPVCTTKKKKKKVSREGTTRRPRTNTTFYFNITTVQEWVPLRVMDVNLQSASIDGYLC